MIYLLCADHQEGDVDVNGLRAFKVVVPIGLLQLGVAALPGMSITELEQVLRKLERRDVPVHVLPEPLVKVLLGLPVAEVVDEDDAVGVGVEDVPGVAVGMETSDVAEL